MKKKKYETPNIVIDDIEACDIITASIQDGNDNGGDIPEGWGNGTY